MEVEIIRGKYPGEWRMCFCTDAWPQASRDIYRGIEHSACDIYRDVLTWTNPGASTPDDVLAALNQANNIIQERLDSDAPLITELSDTATYADVKTTLVDILSVSAWFLASTFESLANGNTSLAVRAFGQAAHWHGVFFASLEHVCNSLDSPPTGPAHALMHREDQRLKPEFLAFCRSIKEAGTEVRTLDDLLNVEGYAPRVTSIQPRTLKKWARGEGITFQAGRPKNMRDRD